MRQPSAGDGFTLLETLLVVAFVGLTAAIGVPITSGTLTSLRSGGDARGLVNAVAVGKMRAASDFSQARLFIDRSTNSYRLEVWQKTGTPGWVTEGGTTYLAPHDTLGFGLVSGPPPNTQPAIAQAPACLDQSGHAIAQTACIVFNSRGIPVDATGAPVGTNALYLTDGSAVYGVTVSASGMPRLWRAFSTGTGGWEQL